MSVDSLMRFFEASNEDATLGQACREAGSRAAVVELGRTRGYEFTEDELSAAFHVLHQHGFMELSEQELEAVAGGGAVARWNFENGWPSKISGPSPKSDGNDVGVEELTLAVETMLRK